MPVDDQVMRLANFMIFQSLEVLIKLEQKYNLFRSQQLLKSLTFKIVSVIDYLIGKRHPNEVSIINTCLHAWVSNYNSDY